MVTNGTFVHSYRCLVCGFLGLTEPPVSQQTGSGSYEICPSCGFEFGVTDDDEGYTYAEWRQKWIDEGMPWRGEGIDDPPQGWNPATQLQDLESSEE